MIEMHFGKAKCCFAVVVEVNFNNILNARSL